MVTVHLEENAEPRIQLEPYKQSLQSASLAGCIELAREWLARCRNSHAECEETSKSEFNYPMRLINIAGETQRLVTIDVIRSRIVRYVALSHCWGITQPLKTLGSNFDRHVKDGIPLSDLPRTFRDASKSILSSVIRCLGGLSTGHLHRLPNGATYYGVPQAVRETVFVSSGRVNLLLLSFKL